MSERDLLAERFEAHRARLRAIAYRTPGSASEADDAADAAEQEALLADSIGPALLVILHTLAPAERLAFVLHGMFAVPFDDIAAIVGRSPAAARQLASRARRRVQGVQPVLDEDLAQKLTWPSSAADALLLRNTARMAERQRIQRAVPRRAGRSALKRPRRQAAAPDAAGHLGSQEANGPGRSPPGSGRVHCSTGMIRAGHQPGPPRR
jgi:Sigma-70, region 4